MSFNKRLKAIMPNFCFVAALLLAGGALPAWGLEAGSGGVSARGGRGTDADPPKTTPKILRGVLIKRVKSPEQAGTLRDAHLRITRPGKSDSIIIVPGPKPKTSTLSAWFDNELKAGNVLTTGRNTWLLYRSGTIWSNDVLWIESIEQKGHTVTVQMNRAKWVGETGKNVRAHEILAVNLGRLPAGTYRVRWIIREMTFDRWTVQKLPGNLVRRWPQNAKLSALKPIDLTTSFEISTGKAEGRE